MLRYEWVDVGMLDYNPANKLYYIKRVHVPNYILQAKSLKFDSEEKSKESSDSGSESNGSGSGVKLESSMEGEAGGASDGEQIAPQPKLSMQQVRWWITQDSFRYCSCGMWNRHLVRGYNYVFSVQ